MSQRAHTALCFNALGDLTRRVVIWLETRLPIEDDYPPAAVANRIGQNLVRLLLNPFLRDSMKRLGAGLGYPPTVDPVLRCAGMRIDTASGATTLTAMMWLKSMGEYWLHWSHIMAAMLRSFMGRRNAPVGPATLVIGVGPENISVEGHDRRFAGFCREGPVTPLAAAKRLVVQLSVKMSSTDPRIEYAHFPMLHLLRDIPRRALAALLVRHIVLAVRFMALTMCYPMLALIGRDIAYHALAGTLNRRGMIENVVITNSNYFQQFLWMTDLPDRRWQLHMVWYSMNHHTMVYREDPVTGIFPSYRYLRADHHWVWTPGQADFLRALDIPGAMHSVGPILWYLPGARTMRDPAVLRVAVFDMLPVNREFERNYGLAYNYYATTTMIAFMRDLVDAVRMVIATHKRPVRLLLKHKRGHSPIHDQEYLIAVEELVRQSGSIDIVPPETNMFDLLAGCDAAVVIPYSSPAYVAAHVRTPALYYDPTESLEPGFEPAPALHFVAGRGALTEALSEVLKPQAPCRADASIGPQSGSVHAF